MERIIESAATLRRDYNFIADLCRNTGQPVFLTKNGAGDLVAMSVEAFLLQDWKIDLRERLVGIEKRRRAGTKDIPAVAVRRKLCEVIEKYKFIPLTEESEYPDGSRKNT